MSRARQAIIANALHERDPGTVLRKANETLLLQDPKMVTAICGYIDPTDLCIVYATAGHPPPILADRDGEARFLDHDGLPLGILPQVDYPSFTVQARGGSLLVLYTDGVIEHKRDLIDGERRLLLATRSALRDPTTDPAASVQHAIFGDKPPIDDVAIMTVSFAAHIRCEHRNGRRVLTQPPRGDGAERRAHHDHGCSGDVPRRRSHSGRLGRDRNPGARADPECDQ